MNNIFLKSSANMSELEDNSVDLIITSPPYFNIKDYSKKGDNHTDDIGAIDSYHDFIDSLLRVWIECERVLKPNAKLCINVPLMPMLKRDLDTHYNRHIFDLQSDIQQSILTNTKLFLYDLYIWNRIYQTRDLMFGSYPYPRNFYAQNTSEFIVVFVKDGKPEQVDKERKEASKLTQKEWVDYTKQIWDIPPPDKSDLAWGIHPAIMPKEIPYRLIRLFSFVGDLVLDPFTGSGTTLAVASQLERHYVGYELYENYAKVARLKIASAKTLL